jgi:hypothetical protein
MTSSPIGYLAAAENPHVATGAQSDTEISKRSDEQSITDSLIKEYSLLDDKLRSLTRHFRLNDFSACCRLRVGLNDSGEIVTK